MNKRTLGKYLGVGVLALGTSIYVLNASWLAPAPSGHPVLIAQRGVHQVYGREGVDDTTCTARHIPSPSHDFIENTLPSISEAFAIGAHVVEVDVRLTKDHEFVLFHDNTLECRTNGTGRVGDRTIAELKALDVGYGYTADDGKTCPFRGKGIGLMPTLEEALKAHAEERFLVQLKDGDPKLGAILVSYLEERGLARWGQLAFFGSAGAVSQLKSSTPEARVWSAGAAGRRLAGYLTLGWIGHVPKACDKGIILIPITQSGFIWGWPNRFLARMRQHRTDVMLIGRIDGLSGANFSRLDTQQELSRLPPQFDGSIWTDRIDVVGPELKRRIAPAP
jgi:glycerophosphoryl diester phosphodiesterase